MCPRLPQFHGRYGANPEGFLTYVTEQLGELRACMARNRTDVECALYFESLGMQEEKVFYHVDQVRARARSYSAKQ